MLEALWTVEYMDAAGWKTGGVVVFETGRVFGGDNRFYYVGRYEADHPRITAELGIRYYHGDPTTAWGDQVAEFQIEVEGERNRDVIEGTMLRVDIPQYRLPCRLTRRADLP